MSTAYLAAEGFEAELSDELAQAGLDVTARHGRLLVTRDAAITAAWAANTWFDTHDVRVRSIGDAAGQLRALQRSWAHYAPTLGGRSRLIQERLPHVSAKALELGQRTYAAPLGSWTLLAPDRLLAAPRCSSAFPNGEVSLAEHKQGPPSRAYRKLWEAFVLLDRFPRPGDRCVDLGASPGGWTWLAATLGASVIAVDKAPLAPPVSSLAHVKWLEGSAFGLEPEAVGPVDWLFCDVIAYPVRILRLVRRWAAMAGTIICTIKFQGPTEHGIVREFASIEGARVMHLHHNKHELTFVRPAPPPAAGGR